MPLLHIPTYIIVETHHTYILSVALFLRLFGSNSELVKQVVWVKNTSLYEMPLPHIPTYIIRRTQQA